MTEPGSANLSNPARTQAAALRVNALVQIAYEMSRGRSDPDRSYSNMRVTLGAMRDAAYQRALTFAIGGADLAYEVARGSVDLAAINPSAFLTMAYRGTGPYPEPLPLRAIAVMPTWDCMLFAVAPQTGLTSIADIAARRYPLRVSIRRNQDHGTRFLIDELFHLHGFSLQDLEAWGGSLHYADSPNEEARYTAMREGVVDAVFDEGIKGWGYIALKVGMQFLDLDPTSRTRVEELGWPLVSVRKQFPSVQEGLLGISFGGWPLFTRADLPDNVAYSMALALDAAGDRMAYDSDGTVALSELCEGTEAAPRDVPLHPGAQRYYRERGCQV